MDSILTGLRILDGETTLVQKSDGTLLELEDLGGGGGGNVDLTNYYTKGETDIRLAFKQHLLDNTAGSGTTLLASNLVRRLRAGSNVTITQDADGNLILASTASGSSFSIPATIATFATNLIELKVATSCHLGLDVTNGIAADIVTCAECKANSFTALSSSTISLNGTQVSQLYASSGSLGSSLVKAQNEFGSQGLEVETNTSVCDIVLRNNNTHRSIRLTGAGMAFGLFSDPHMYLTDTAGVIIMKPTTVPSLVCNGSAMRGVLSSTGFLPDGHSLIAGFETGVNRGLGASNIFLMAPTNGNSEIHMGSISNSDAGKIEAISAYGFEPTKLRFL